MSNKTQSKRKSVICIECTANHHLQEIMQNQVHFEYCDYCGQEFSSPMGMYLHELAELISDAIDSEFPDPLEVLYYDENWVNHCLDDSKIIEIIREQAKINNDNTVDDIVYELSDCLFCREPYSSKDYCDELLYQTYLNNDEVAKWIESIISIESSNIIIEYKSATPLGKKTKIFRSRNVDKKDSTKKLRATDLGTPPQHLARDNRFNEKDNPIFYGASTEKTAIYESGTPKVNEKKNYSSI